MNFGFSEEQELLRSTARKFFENECPSEVVRELMESPEGMSRELWAKIAEQGWLGLIHPEEHGGLGLGMVDLVVLMEEMGRASVPGPFFSTVLLGGLAIAEAGSDAQKKQWLPRISVGEHRVTLAWMEPSATLGAQGITLQATRSGDRFTLAGTKLFVHDAHTADAIVVAARTGGGKSAEEGVSLFLLPRETPGLTTKLLPTMDQTRKLCEVSLTGVTVGADALLGAAGQGWKPLARVLDRATVALCAEMCGGAQKVLDMTVEYAKIRQAFGRPIGSFQAIKHKLADMYVRNELARSNAYYAAWALDAGIGDLPLAASAARVAASEAYEYAAKETIQTHGGIGATWEADMHLFYRRARLLMLMLDSPPSWRNRLVSELEGLVAA